MYVCGCPVEVGQRDMFCAVIIFIVDVFYPICLLTVINLNAFDVALACLLHAVFKLMSPGD